MNHHDTGHRRAQTSFIPSCFPPFVLAFLFFIHPPICIVNYDLPPPPSQQSYIRIRIDCWFYRRQLKQNFHQITCICKVKLYYLHSYFCTICLFASILLWSVELSVFFFTLPRQRQSRITDYSTHSYHNTPMVREKVKWLKDDDKTN